MAYRKPRRGGFILETSVTESAGAFLFIPFMFNPEEIDESETANYAKHEVPGRADPYIQYVSGSGLTLAFTMVIDNERLRELANYLGSINRYAGQELTQAVIDVFENRQLAKFSDFYLSDDQIRNLDTYIPDTADLYIEQIRKLMLPSESDDWTVKSPPLLTFVLGASTFKGRITDMNVTKYLFTPNLDTKYAEIAISMIRDNPVFPRFFRRLPKSVSDIKLPFSTEPTIDRSSYIGQRRGYVNR